MDILERVFVYNFNLKTFLYDYLDHRSLLSLCQVNKAFRERSKFIYNLIFSKVALSLKLFIQSPFRYMINNNDKNLHQMLQNFSNLAISRERCSSGYLSKTTNDQDTENRCDLTVLMKNQTLRNFLFNYARNYCD